MDLKKLSKKALEAIGRDKGIELDRRLKKDKLVEQLQDALDNEQSVEEVVAEPKKIVGTHTRIEGWDYINNCWDRNTEVGYAKYHEELRKRH